MTYLTIAKITKYSSALREPVSVLAAFLKPFVGVETIGCFPLFQGHWFFFDDLLEDVMFLFALDVSTFAKSLTPRGAL